MQDKNESFEDSKLDHICEFTLIKFMNISSRSNNSVIVIIGSNGTENVKHFQNVVQGTQ